jgi:hypothetical protein
LPEYFATRPLIPLPDAKPMNLLELLRAPAVGAPRSLSDQLALIRKLWKPLHRRQPGALLRDGRRNSARRRAGHLDAVQSSRRRPPSGLAARAASSSGLRIVSTAEVPVFGDPAHEYEKFSADTAWMPTAVLIAKSTYVWLAQLSKQYGRHIGRLDEIPDEELATLARRGSIRSG